MTFVGCAERPVAGLAAAEKLPTAGLPAHTVADLRASRWLRSVPTTDRLDQGNGTRDTAETTDHLRNRPLKAGISCSIRCGFWCRATTA